MSQGQFSSPASGKGQLKASPAKRELTLKFSLAGVVGLCIVIILGLGWIFAFGVMVGRGIEEKVPAIGKVLAPAEKNANEHVAAEILKAEDLTFMADLKNQSPARSEQPPPTPIARAGSSAVPIEQPAADQKPSAPIVGPIPSGSADTSAEKRISIFDYVIQVIVYKNSSQADSFREILEGDGFRTRLVMEKDARGNIKWYKVHILLRGSESDLADARSRLIKYGIRETSLLSSKPVSQR
jgi:cell division protein FtsN